MTLDTRLIRQKFDASARVYHNFASLQLRVAQRLLKAIQFPPRLEAEVGQTQPVWLDVGCGPGTLWQAMDPIQRASLRLWAIDLAPNMLQEAAQHVPGCCWVNGDMDQLPIADGALSGIVSSFAMHWSRDWLALLSEFNRCLAENGLLALAFPIEPSFFELDESWRCVDGKARRHGFPSTLAVWQAMQTLPWVIQGWQQTLETMTFATVAELVNTLKGMGVTNSRRDRDPGLMTPRRWSQFVKAYGKQKTAEGRLPVSYSVLWIYAKKRVS